MLLELLWRWLDAVWRVVVASLLRWLQTGLSNRRRMSQMHCSEYQLELLAAFPGELTKLERAQISLHASKCRLCEEHLATLRRFYADLEHRHEQEPSEKDKSYAALLCAKGFSIYQFPNFRWN